MEEGNNLKILDFWRPVTSDDIQSGIETLKTVLALNQNTNSINIEIQRSIDTLILLREEIGMRTGGAKLHFNWYRLFDNDTHDTVPTAPGIYLFVECDFEAMTKKIVYVGMSLNLQQRLCMSTHHAYFKWLMRNRNNNKHILRYYMPTEDCVEKEIRYIKRFRPMLNVKDNREVD